MANPFTKLPTTLVREICGYLASRAAWRATCRYHRDVFIEICTSLRVRPPADQATQLVVECTRHSPRQQGVCVPNALSLEGPQGRRKKAAQPRARKRAGRPKRAPFGACAAHLTRSAKGPRAARAARARRTLWPASVSRESVIRYFTRGWNGIFGHQRFRSVVIYFESNQTPTQNRQSSPPTHPSATRS